MDKRQLTQDLVTRFGDKKESFLSDVRHAVTGYISSQGSSCLTLIERKSNGPEVWSLSPHPGYALRLIAFCTESKYDGHVIDSGLTEPVIGIVTRQFEMLYQSNDEIISKAILNYIMEDKALSKSLINTIVGSASAKKLSEEVKDKVASLIVSQIKHLTQTGAAKAVIATVGKTVAAVAAKPIATKIATLLMKLIAVHLKTIIAKVLASAAIKGIIAAAVKKFLIAAIAATVVKAIAAKFGISASAAFLWVLLPVIAAYLIYEVATFPQHLGEKVGDKVVEDLRGSYNKINDDVFERIVYEVIDVGIGALASELAQNREVQDGIKELINGL
jgi:hypothetical protein